VTRLHEYRRTKCVGLRRMSSVCLCTALDIVFRNIIFIVIAWLNVIFLILWLPAIEIFFFNKRLSPFPFIEKQKYKNLVKERSRKETDNQLFSKLNCLRVRKLIEFTRHRTQTTRRSRTSKKPQLHFVHKERQYTVIEIVPLTITLVLEKPILSYLIDCTQHFQALRRSLTVHSTRNRC